MKSAKECVVDRITETKMEIGKWRRIAKEARELNDDYLIPERNLEHFKGKLAGLQISLFVLEAEEQKSKHQVYEYARNYN